MIPKDVLNFCWIVDFPMFEYDEKTKKLSACHHPFTSPNLEDIGLIDSDPLKVRAVAYDLCLNGEEIGGGSIRIHSREVQSKVFKAIGIDEEKAKERFGFLLEALGYGTPPHGGIAFGFDRIMMILLNKSSIRDVIAFPKTQSGVCLMTNAPSPVDEEQLLELNLKIIPKL
jgi:aspartyl-tRNA synthetase